MTDEEQLALVRTLHERVLQAAREHPDYKYKSRRTVGGCLYNPDENNPLGCIIGYALRECGYDTSALDVLNTDGDLTSRWSALPAIAHLVLGFSEAAVETVTDEYQTACKRLDLDWFRFVQTAQDAGKTWEDAVGYTPAWKCAVPA